MLKQLHLSQFKNFRDATLVLGPFTVLVGANASGKSNIRDAFRFPHGIARDYALAEIIGEKWVEGGVLQWRGIRGGTREVCFSGTDTFRLEVKFNISDGNWINLAAPTHYGIEVGITRVPLAHPRMVAEYLHSYEPVFDSHPAGADPVAQQGEPDHLLVRLRKTGTQRKYGQRIALLDMKPALTQLAEHPKLESRGNRAGVNETIALFESMRFLDLSPDAMRMPSIPGQAILGDRGENLSSVLELICSDESRKETLLDWIRELTPMDAVDFEFQSDAAGRILLTLVERSGIRTSAYSVSDGTLRFLAKIAALLGPEAARFYFFEEIDAGIHPNRLSLLVQLIEQQVELRNIQVVTTTHSPQLLGLLQKKDAGSRIRRLSLSGYAGSTYKATPRSSKCRKDHRPGRRGLPSCSGLDGGCDGILYRNRIMRILVIPEDFRKDQFILQPIITAMMEDIGMKRAQVRVLRDPLLGGISEALRMQNLTGIIERYRAMVDLFILCVDRDGNATRRSVLDNLEKQLGVGFLAEHAWQELEVWVLGGHDLPSDWMWASIRTENHPKERYFEPFAALRKVADGPGGGRKALAEAAARRFRRVCQLCPEDVANLRDRVATHFRT
jgi:predicted ATPase